MQAPQNHYQAYVLRVWRTDVEPHCRMMLKQIEGGETWYFTHPAELSELLEELSEGERPIATFHAREM